MNSLPDLLGSDASLLPPLRDLMLRPGLRRLLQQQGQASRLLSGRDSLIADLQLTYSGGVTDRLHAVLNGLLNLPDTQPATRSNWVQPSPAQPANNPPPTTGSAYVSNPAPATVTYTVQAPSSGQNGLIALLALICGGVMVGLMWLLMNPPPQQKPATAQPAAKPPETPQPVPTPRQPSPLPSNPSNPWGRPEDYKFGQGPSATYPNTCAFSQTDALGQQTLADKSPMEFWACRDEGGNADSGYAVTWGDGKRTVYRFSNGGSGAVVGTNGQEVPMQWRNDSHNGQQIIVISHQDGATSWIPGNVGD